VALLTLSRQQILAYRRSTAALEERLPPTTHSLRQAAWAGLQDSMPRAALLSLHARVRGIRADALASKHLVQIWGPRYSTYVVYAKDLAVFSLGRLPSEGPRRARAETTAWRLEAHLAGRRLPFGQAGREMGVIHNSLRYAAPTGRVLIDWDGARQPLVWTVAAPSMSSDKARLELARRFLHIFAPAGSASFAKWAGIRPGEAKAAFELLAKELLRVRTSAGEDWILKKDEPAFKTRLAPAAARLLPSGDTYFLLWGSDRTLLLPEAKQRAALWTSRVWPGALLVHGEIAGVWRRAGAVVLIESWLRPSAAERRAVEEEARALPLPGEEAIEVRWETKAQSTVRR
jgi:hypothetical protein